jgi:RNA recognition motif-containing protein
MVSVARHSGVSTSIYVSNLAATTTKELLATKFGEFGTVLSVKIGRDRESGQSKCYGFVEMKTSDEARFAVRALNATRLDGRLLCANRAARS